MEKKEDMAEQEAKKLLDEIGITEADVIALINDQYNESIEFTTAKREIFKRRDKLYLGIKDQEKKLYVRLVYSVVDTLLAIEHSDERSVIFNGRQVGTEDFSDNVNNVAKFDFEQMKCEPKKYEVRKDKYLRGVGIEVMTGWDDVLNVPVYKVIDPMVWCPDWFGDVNSGPRFHGFEYQANRYELENDDTFFDIDNCSTNTQLDELTVKAQENVALERGINNLTTNRPNDLLNIYYHYFKLDGKPYLAVLGNRLSKLIKFEAIPAMTDIEKKDPTKIDFPVVVRYYRPLRYDPYGVSIPDLLEDKEAMIQLFHNLNRIKAEHEALGDLFLFDPDKVDVNNLTIPTLGPKYIPVTGMASMQGGQVAMQEVSKGQIKPDAMNMPLEIRQQGTLAVGMDEQTLGVAGANNMTATENQRIQSNANLRLMLGIKWDNYAEKQFWLLWYKFYLFHFDNNKVKNFALNDSVGRVFYSVKKKDFGGLTDIDIEIKSKTDLEAQKEKEKVGTMAMAQYTLNDPNTKPSQRAFIMREMYRLNGMPPEKINRIVAMPPEERRATEHIALLNKNEMPPKITNLDEDHRTYIAVYDRALNTDAKWKAIERRKLALEMSGQNIPQQMPQQEQGGQMGNMITNDMLQQSNKVQNGASSLASISQ